MDEDEDEDEDVTPRTATRGLHSEEYYDMGGLTANVSQPASLMAC